MSDEISDEAWRPAVIQALKRALARVEAGGALPRCYSVNSDHDDIAKTELAEALQDWQEATPDDGDEWGLCVPMQWRTDVEDTDEGLTSVVHGVSAPGADTGKQIWLFEPSGGG